MGVPDRQTKYTFTTRNAPKGVTFGDLGPGDMFFWKEGEGVGQLVVKIVRAMADDRERTGFMYLEEGVVHFASSVVQNEEVIPVLKVEIDLLT